MAIPKVALALPWANGVLGGTRCLYIFEDNMTAPIILSWMGKTPNIAADAFIAPGTVIVGDVEIGSKSSVWFGVVIRGDVNSIRIGARSNIQDGTIIHVDSGRKHKHNPRVPQGGFPTIIGDDVTIGHMAMLHGCTLESGSFIGMRSIIMDGAVVEGGAMVAAGALVSPGKRVAKGQLWAGMPAKYIRDLKPEEMGDFDLAAEHYVSLGSVYRMELLKSR